MLTVKLARRQRQRARRSQYPTLPATTNIGASHRRALACDGCVFSASAAWVLIARQKLVRSLGPRSSAAPLRRRLCILAHWGLLGLTAALQRLSRRWKAPQTTDGLARGWAVRKHHAGPAIWRQRRIALSLRQRARPQTAPQGLPVHNASLLCAPLPF